MAHKFKKGDEILLDCNMDYISININNNAKSRIRFDIAHVITDILELTPTWNKYSNMYQILVTRTEAHSMLYEIPECFIKKFHY